MNILAVDATADNLVVALSKNNEIFSRTTYDGAKRHNSQILILVEEVLNEAALSIGDVDYFAAVVGPGSFTGIRIGVSSVNALAFACGRETVAINSLEELAYPYHEKEFVTAIDCRHDCYYYARFKDCFENMTELGEMTSRELNDQNCLVIKKTFPSSPDNLIGVAKTKIAKGEFSALAPLYLKKSQAEREMEAKNMDKTVE